MHSFKREFETDRKLLVQLAVAEAVTLAAVSSVLIFADSRFHVFGLVLALLGVLGAVGVLFLLYRSFRQEPIVEEKYEFLRKRQHFQRALAKAEAEIMSAQNQRVRITDSEKNTVAKRERIHDRLLADISRRREQAGEDERDEITEELRRHQQRYSEDGLRGTRVTAGGIKGVGPGLVRRLSEHGIQTAADISYAKVEAIPGFGQAKASAATGWRADVERELRATSPQRLPEDFESRIRSHYKSLLRSLDDEEGQEHRDLKEDIAAARARAENEHAANDEAEHRALDEASEFASELDQAETDLRPYERINFREFIRRAIIKTPEDSGKISPATVYAAAGLVAGLVCQTTGALASVGSMYVASLPTATPTTTATFTASPSATPTATVTASPSFTPSSTHLPTATFTPSTTPTPSNTPSPTVTLAAIDAAACVPSRTVRETARVIQVIDGDTIDVLINGEAFTVRYIGIDAPESGGDDNAFLATRRNRQLVQDQTVTLVKDVSETDRFDRLLRYVLAGDEFVNYALVREGFAYAKDYPPDSSCAHVLNDAAAQARAEMRGIYIPTVTPTATRNIVIVTAVPGPSGGGNCHPSYPTVCIPPPPPDLDCGDISFRRFAVTGSDPHNFDGDGDGIGCES